MLQAALIAWIALCALQDARSRRIPNPLIGVGVLLALLPLLLWQASLTGAPWRQAVLAVLIALALSLPGYCLGRMGAGDVKLLAVIGLASDPTHVLAGVLGAGAGMALWALLAPPLFEQFPQPLQDRLHQFAPSATRAWPYAPFLLPGILVASLTLQ